MAALSDNSHPATAIAATARAGQPCQQMLAMEKTTRRSRRSSAFRPAGNTRSVQRSAQNSSAIQPDLDLEVLSEDDEDELDADDESDAGESDDDTGVAGVRADDPDDDEDDDLSKHIPDWLFPQKYEATVSVSEIVRHINAGALIVDPEWQRKYVWKNKAASRLIESVILGLYVPSIVVRETKNAKFQVIDGAQRGQAIKRFLSNEMVLSGLETMPKWNGKRFRELPAVVQRQIENGVVGLVKIGKGTPDKVVRMIFARLNRGGTSLNTTEVWNGHYAGPLMKLIREMTRDVTFNQSVSIPESQRKRMKDMEYVITFLGCTEMSPDLLNRRGIKVFLERFLEQNQDAGEDVLSEYRRGFLRAMKAAHSIFGENAFRIRKVDADGNGEYAKYASTAVFRAIAPSLHLYAEADLTRNADAIREAYLELTAADPQWVRAVTEFTTQKKNLDYARRVWRERLREIMESSEEDRRKRLFSAELKRERFAASPICGLCSNEIMSLLDTHVDHVEQYAHGGGTVAANARITHRICNLQRTKAAVRDQGALALA